MPNRINKGVIVAGIVILILMAALSAGCLKSAQKVIGGDTKGETSIEEPSPIPDPSGVGSQNPGSPDAIPPPATPAPATSLAVDEVNPAPYITPDPYRLPYRDHGNWSTAEPVRVPKIPQYTKSYVLRSNSTAVRVNVTQAPLVIDLTFKPQWANPDHTGIGGGTNDDGSVSTGTSMNSFVYSTAVVTIYPDGSRSVVERDGYGKEFSTDLKKKITIYREGAYVIALSGDFMDVTMTVTTGTAEEKPVVSQAAAVSSYPEEEAWG